MSSRSFNNVISEIVHSSSINTTFNISRFIRIMNRYWTYQSSEELIISQYSV